MRNQKGFSFMESLIVLAIIGIIAAIAIPVLGKAGINEEFRAEFGFGRNTSTPELFTPVLQEYLGLLCSQHRFLRDWADEALSGFPGEFAGLSSEDVFARREDLLRLDQARYQMRKNQVQEARKHYERVHALAVENRFIPEGSETCPSIVDP